MQKQDWSHRERVWNTEVFSLRMVVWYVAELILYFYIQTTMLNRDKRHQLGEILKFLVMNTKACRHINATNAATITWHCHRLPGDTTINGVVKTVGWHDTATTEPGLGRNGSSDSQLQNGNQEWIGSTCQHPWENMDWWVTLIWLR